MRIGKIASSAEYRLDKQFQNLLIFLNFDSFPNWKNSVNLLIFQFREFQKCIIKKISQFPKIAIIAQLKKFTNFF